jgi:hypothetical protein
MEAQLSYARLSLNPQPKGAMSQSRRAFMTTLVTAISAELLRAFAGTPADAESCVTPNPLAGQNSCFVPAFAWYNGVENLLSGNIRWERVFS